MYEALKKMYEKIEHFHLKCIVHIFEKTEFKKVLKKLSKKIFQVTWDAITKVAQVRSQLSSTRGEISSLELLLAFREARWENATRSAEFQNELCQVQEKITKLEWSVRGKEVLFGLEIGDYQWLLSLY